ncbi:hypothetical protein PCASD_00450 [Puccinia coronata f. sp. avenae]|uniref:Uncharacterized protein n=1 Tax=Puccinia coronata f. sp. avenae TaxID=200324 RepID=A0A2N5VNQ7_9BASI|nr:hypothetical protein PCASD_00450 [Puccinia coronata f. sp. avenae]
MQTVETGETSWTSRKRVRLPNTATARAGARTLLARVSSVAALALVERRFLALAAPGLGFGAVSPNCTAPGPADNPIPHYRLPRLCCLAHPRTAPIPR